MTTNIDMTRIHEVVTQTLPVALSKSEEELLADIGVLALGDLTFHTEPSQEELETAGDEFLQTNIRLHGVICDAANKKLIEDTLSTANVTALVGLLLPLFSTVVAVPAVVISLAVLILRIGINTYCRGYKSPS